YNLFMKLRDFIYKNSELTKKEVFTKKGEETDNTSVIYRDMFVTSEDSLFFMDKPKGVEVTTHKNKDIRKFLPKGMRETFLPIGRLDKQSSGLLIFTNKLDLINKWNKDKSFYKTYEVDLKFSFEKKFKSELENGIILKNKDKVLSSLINLTDNNKKIIIKIKEGKYHQIRRMFAYANNHVLDLRRIMYKEYDISFSNKLISLENNKEIVLFKSFINNL
ncbi:MAG: hypothetical protein K4H23_04550, partial [Mollicutes bacterium PWAP]|nr:hypothetical protein [Mollicutes bacterium PWAP]